ncbi:MAG: NUDIX hydrolase [Betaproteobacteria bacterium RIFCSPLOWO2_12_FULL_65_110]|nr:MAG: NUDIX hydrolase [Betaproteobacteria bacterium RIFCSPLOWO2_12_FULL_65_110]
MTWKPSVTVAAVMERDGRFLLVEEIEEGGGESVYNQPAGHWECDETLAQACARETLEESAHRFEPKQLVGVYRWRAARGDPTYLRFAFCGETLGVESGRALDEGILRAVWLTVEEIRALAPRHRSPLVWRCVEDYLAGRRYPLDLITHFA